MAGLGDIFGSLGIGGFGGMSGLLTIIVISLGAIGLCGGIIYYFWNKKQWNLIVEFKLPRAVKLLKEGETLDINNIQGTIEREIGKGGYNPKKGVVWLKRKGKKKISMKPFKVTKYLSPTSSGSVVLEVIQVGAEDYLPVIPESYLLLKDEETGEEVCLANLKCDLSTSKAWKNSFERESKQAYSVSGALSQLLTNPAFLVGLVIFLWGLQLLLIYNKIKG